MNIYRKITIGLAGFVCLLAVSVLIIMLTVNATIMNRDTVKGWLVKSKIYDTNIVAAFTQATGGDTSSHQAGVGKPESSSSSETDAVKSALAATLTPDFVQKQSESLIDSAFNYADGKSTSFKFSIPLDQKKAAFIQNLEAELTPQIAALPVCNGVIIAAGTLCRPATMTVDQLTAQVSASQVDQLGIFNSPISNDSTAKSDGAPTDKVDNSPLSKLPQIRNVLNILFIVVPVTIVAMIVIVGVVAVRDQRITVLLRLARHIFVATTLPFIAAVILNVLATKTDMGIAAILGNGPNQLGSILAPLIKVIVSDVSFHLALYTGYVCAVTAVAWIGFAIWRHQIVKRHPVPAVEPPIPSQPTMI